MLVLAELLWFEGCPNHEAAEALLLARAEAVGVSVRIVRIEVPDERTGRKLRFPGSPTIRINGRDIEPDWEPCEDCTPRCRVYLTSSGLRGLPEPHWIDEALLGAPA